MAGSVKVDASWFERDDIEQLGAGAAIFLLSALAYSARNLTDGEIPRRQVRRLWAVDDIEGTVAALVAAGQLEDRGEVLHLLHWRDFILAASEVVTIREQTRVRTERHRRHSKGDHSMCDRCSAVRNGVTNGVSNTPSEPNRAEPSRAEPQGEGSRSAAGTDPDGAGAPPDRAEAEARLGRTAHSWAGDCCPLPENHPIHAGGWGHDAESTTC